MASESIFNKLRLSTGKLITLILTKIAPGYSNSRIDALLFVPSAVDSKPLRVPKEFRQSVIQTPDGAVKIFQTGKGPGVLFVHGWGGSASQFFPLMRGLSRCGFTAIAFDHLGHGESDRKTPTLHQSILTTNHLLNQIKNKTSDGLCAIVAHSTGCITVASARNSLVKDVPLFLISPIFNYKLFFLKKLIKLNLHPNLLQKYAARFTKVYVNEYQKLELERNLTRYGDVTVIAHDETDTDSPVSASVKFCNKYPLTKLMLTREYGHNRIINSESVWHELKSHLNYEDTTINFAQKILKE